MLYDLRRFTTSKLLCILKFLCARTLVCYSIHYARSLSNNHVVACCSGQISVI
uniref:Uncharacterized protein n=1 Tax=Arundo donax TaxID=35708 RepID=A0A0A9CJ60_ARUDO